MTGRRFLRLLVWDFCAWWQRWQILPALALFVLIGAYNALRVGAEAGLPDTNIWHAVLLAFAGPDLWGGSMLDALQWLLPHLLYFYLIGNLANDELMRRGYAVIPLIGSRRTWWRKKMLLLLLLAVAYALLWFLLVMLGAAFVLPITLKAYPFENSAGWWPYPPGIHIGSLLLWIFGLYISTLCAMSLAQTTFAIWGRRSFHAYVVIVIVSILSWLLGIDQPGLVRWLPGAQSMLSRHNFLEASVPNFTFGWSLIYNAVLLLVVLVLSAWYIRRLDIFGAQFTETR